MSATGEKSTLYVVMGETGEYSDRSEWPIRAFVDKAKAETFVRGGDDFLRANGAHYDSPHAPGHSLPENPWGISGCDYTGARLYMMEVELDDEVRQEIAASVIEAGPRVVALSGKIGNNEGRD